MSRHRRYYLAHRARLLEAERVRQQINAAAIAQRKKRYALAHSDEIAAYHRAYYVAHREGKKAANQARYRALTPEKQARRREKSREWERRARAKNPLTFRVAGRIKQARRRARARHYPDTWTLADSRFALAYWQGCCAVCGRAEGFWYTIALDHWIPLTDPACPGTVPGNLVPLCHAKKGIPSALARPCNNHKGPAAPQTWLQDTYGPVKGRKHWRAIERFLAAHRAYAVGTTEQCYA